MVDGNEGASVPGLGAFLSENGHVYGEFPLLDGGVGFGWGEGRRLRHKYIRRRRMSP